MKTKAKWFSALSGALATAVVLMGGAVAQQVEDASTYPSKPVKIVVPFTPGGPNDILARMVADELNAAWKSSIIVDNRPGGGTIIGTQAVARSPADGYTLLMVSLSTATNISLKKSLPYDTLKDFTPVIQLAESSNVLVANRESPVRTVADLIAEAKRSPGQISYAVGGLGSATDLASHLLLLSTGTKMTPVPYKGDSPALIDLMSGRVTWMFGTILSVMPYIQSDKIRAVAVTGGKRVAALPDVPTVAETVPNFEANSWYGIFAPAGTPPAIVAKLNGAINEILKGDKIRTFLQQQGTTAVGGSSEAFGALFRSEVDKWGKVIREAGIEVQ